MRLCKMGGGHFSRKSTSLAVCCLGVGLLLMTWNILYGPITIRGDETVCLSERIHHTGGILESSTNWESTVSEQKANFIRAIASHASDNTILLAGTDSAFVDMAINFYEASLQPFGISNYLFACSDNACCDTLHARNISCYVYRLDSSGTEASNFGSKVFLKKMNVRTDMILDVLSAGFSVLHCDTDLVFLQNPFDHINCGEDCDMAALSDTSDYNAGFIFIRPTRKSIEIYQNMKKIAVRSPKVDDQDQLTMSIGAKQKKDKSFKAVRLPDKLFLCGLYYFEHGNRVFAGDNPCKNCVVVHNNWIVSKAAKVYRFKEHLMWMYDDQAYYSSSSRRYILYDNPLIFKGAKDTKQEEFVALQNALALGIILNRTVILPSFHVFKKNAPKTAAFNFLYLVRKFDDVFRSAYREHVFLQHKKVPDSVKLSRSAPHLIVSENVNRTLVEKNLTVSNSTQLHVASQGASVDDIRNWFGEEKDSVLVFHSLYRAFAGFTGNQKTEFEKKIKSAFKAADQRQFG